MKTKNKFIIFFFVICVLYFSCIPLLAYEMQDVNVEEFPSFISRNERGYDVYIYELENFTNRPQKVDIIVNVNNRYNSTANLEITKQVELVANEKNRKEKIFFPVRENNYSGEAKFYVNGKLIKSFNLDKKTRSYGNRSCILMDKSITANDSDKLFNDYGLDWSEKNNYNILYFESNLNMMDKDWISYYQYSALIFYDHTYRAIPSAVQDGIMDYVKAGGNLIILGEIFVPTDFWGGRVDSPKNYSSSGVRKIYSIGFGRVFLCDSNLFDKIKSTPKSSGSSSYGSYGRKSEKKEEVKESSSGVYVPKDILREFSLQKKNRFSELKVEDCFDDEYKAMTSVALLTVLVFVFAIIIGPVNFGFLNHYEKRILIFVTVPLIALVCCSIIFVYFLIFEFGRLDIYRQSFVMLDENTNTSLTLGGEIIVSGKSMNNHLSFPLNSIITTDRGGYRFRESSGGVKGIRLDKAQNFTYNWIRAKDPLYYSIISIKQDRSRVEISQTGSGLEILNGLGAEIGVIFYKDLDGRTVYKGTNIKAGGRSSIGKSTESFRSYNSYIDLYNIFKNYKSSNNGLTSAESFIKNLRAGEYIAYLKTDPFLKQDLDSKANIREMGCFVYGRSKKEAAK